jgi:hypothetical protein
MEVEKASSKSGGFFKIFDWGKKPKRKLFASSPTSGEYLNIFIWDIHLGPSQLKMTICSFKVRNVFVPVQNIENIQENPVANFLDSQSPKYLTICYCEGKA